MGRYSQNLQAKLAYSFHALLLAVCVVICLFLFHGLLDQSLVLWFLLTAVITGCVFCLAYLIRRKIRQYSAAQKAAGQAGKKA